MSWARLWIRLLAPMVPGRRRRAWVEEWDGELLYGGGPATRAWGAVADAWTLRTEGWTMEAMVRDVRSAMRGLLRRPFFTALAGVTLAVGIGANTAIFSVVDGVLLDPLPFPQPDRLVSLNHKGPGLGVPVVPHSEGTYLHYRAHMRSVRSFAVFTEDNVNLVTGTEPRRLAAARVTAEFFDVLGVPPARGRGFASGEDREGAEPVAVVSHALWSDAFGADPSLVGRTVEMDGVLRRVIGIMPEGFRFPGETDVWYPIPIDEANAPLGNLGLLGVARLADGATVRETNREMQALLLRLSDEHPDELPRSVLEQTGLAADVKPLKDLYTADLGRTLWILLGTVGLVLLIACANVANLFLVRAEGRRRERAVRAALGAGRGDLARMYLTESVVLAVGGGVLGVGLAHVGLRALLRLAPEGLPRAGEIGIDGSVLAFTAAVSVVAGLLFGLAPALGGGGGDLSDQLKDGGRGTAGGGRQPLRSGLVVAQVALAMVLLAGAGLMGRSFAALRSVDLGFEDEGRLTFRISLPSAEYPDAAGVGTFYRDLLERLRAVPGVDAAGLTSALPLQDHKAAGPMESEERPLADDELGVIVERRYIAPGYLSAMGVDLEGRELTWDDRADGVRGIVVNRALARALWPGEPAVGKRLRSQGGGAYWEVVGVADDVRFEEVQKAATPLAYFPLVSGDPDDPVATRSVDVVLRTAGDPLALVPAAREALRAADPRLPMVAPRTVSSLVAESMAPTAFTVVLLGIAAGIALLLGSVGIYGVISFVVTMRTAEIGVRMALGAPAARVLREVIAGGMAMVGAGLLLGLAGAWAATRVLASLLYGVEPGDPATLGATAAVLAAVALVAAWLPARRAAAVDPVEALRAE